MPDETLIAGIGTFKATDGDDRTLLLDLTSDGVCGSLGSLCCLGMSYFGLIRLVCTTDPRWFLFFSRNVLQNTLVFVFVFFFSPLTLMLSLKTESKCWHSTSLVRLKILYNMISSQDCYLFKI